MAAIRAAYMAITTQIQKGIGDGFAGGATGFSPATTVKLPIGLGSLTTGSITRTCQK